MTYVFFFLHYKDTASFRSIIKNNNTEGKHMFGMSGYKKDTSMQQTIVTY